MRKIQLNNKLINLYLLSVYCFVVSLTYEHNQSWHLFKNSINNNVYDSYVSSVAQRIRDSWGIAYGNINKVAYKELQFDRAIDAIYQHQHPPDCNNVSYLLSEGYSTGFGSEIHVEGFGLAMAMELGRVYMPMRERFPDKLWQTPKSLCDGDHSWSCYFEPWTNCTYDHVDRLIENQPQIKGYQRVRVYKYSEADIEHFKKTGRISQAVIDSRKNETVARIILTSDFAFRHIIPYQVSNLIDTRRISMNNVHYWWRAVSAAYLIQPNQKTQSLIRKYSTPGLDELNGRCVSGYVRHGDKAIEMHLIPFSVFGSTADLLWDMTYNVKRNYSFRSFIRNRRQSVEMKLHQKRTFFFGTETPQVIKDGLTWGKHTGWTVIYNPIQDKIFQEKGIEINYNNTFSNNSLERYLRETITKKSLNSNITTHKLLLKHYQSSSYHLNKNKPNSTQTVKHKRKKTNHHPELEFLSMIVNLSDLMKCNAFVCTLMSNYCRLLDEMRAVVGAKPSALFADLSTETCSKPPCIGPDHISSFDWR